MAIIPAQYYEVVYLLVVTVLTILYIVRYKANPQTEYRSFASEKIIGLTICGFMIFFIGTRPISEVFVDMAQYDTFYNLYDGITYEFDPHTTNIIYDNLMFFLISIRFAPVYFYVLIAAIYFGCAYLACCRLFPRDSLVAFIVFLAAFSTFSYATNGIKAGAAASIFLLGVAYRYKIIISLPLVALSMGFHHSMVLPAVAFICTLLYHKPNLYFYFWAFCLLMAIAHVQFFQYLFARFSDDQGAEYLTSSAGYLTGFRPDFILYSAAPVYMGWLAVRKHRIRSIMYETLLCTYLLTNGIWMLCMYASFTNRIAYLSWSLYPIVLIYPILYAKREGGRNKTFLSIVFLHLCFTLFMSFFYYGLFKMFI